MPSEQYWLRWGSATFYMQLREEVKSLEGNLVVFLFFWIWVIYNKEVVNSKKSTSYVAFCSSCSPKVDKQLWNFLAVSFWQLWCILLKGNRSHLLRMRRLRWFSVIYLTFVFSFSFLFLLLLSHLPCRKWPRIVDAPAAISQLHVLVLSPTVGRHLHY